MKQILVALFSLSLITGCAGVASTQTDDQEGQSGSGKDRWQVTFFENGEPKEILVDLGRDKDNLVMRVDSPLLGKIYYSVGNASGVQQAVVRAQLEAYISNNKTKQTKEIVDGLIVLLDKLATSGAF